MPLLGADGFIARWNQRHLLARRAGVHVVVLEHLLQRYGSEVDVLIEAIQQRPELGRPLPGAADYLAVEVWFGVAARGSDASCATCSPAGPGSRWRPGTAARRRRPVSPS